MTNRPNPPAAPPPDADDEQLPCGRLLSQVWGNWEDGIRDEHEQCCVHCQEAVRDLEELGSAVRELRENVDDSTADFDAAALTRRVMDVVRLELRPGRPLPLGHPDEDLWITESVAARTLRAAAEKVSGVRAGSCTITPEQGPAAGQVTVRIAIRAPLTTPDLTDLAARVRRQVELAADDRLGLTIRAIDVLVSDLAEAPSTTEEGPER
ncbi:Asp23/Gls24 family envelope stress response protein [Streptomyces sp. NPDC048111]|uniref:Asp23/Gls24 family envelope stress response protein n=1 Tax=Streptomyces sp. NPDC048111 TaxID=3365500 RepID=UPI003712E224